VTHERAYSRLFAHARTSVPEDNPMAATEQQVLEALKELTDPNTRKDYVSSKSARNV